MERNPVEFRRDESRAKQDGKLGKPLTVWDDSPVKGFPFKASDVSGAAQRMIIYKSVDLSIELHIRISYSEFDLGEEQLCWNSVGPVGRESAASATRVDLGIYSYRHYIITVIQKAEFVADPEITRMAAYAVMEKIREKSLSMSII